MQSPTESSKLDPLHTSFLVDIHRGGSDILQIEDFSVGKSHLQFCNVKRWRLACVEEETGMCGGSLINQTTKIWSSRFAQYFD